MNIEEANEILGLKPGASEGERHDAFRRLQTKLEDKLARAPTPGLKEKYRASLLKLEAAIETLELATDSGDLPALRPDYDSEAPAPEEPARDLSRTESAPAATGKRRPAPSREALPATAGGHRKEIILCSLIVLLMIAGGVTWWFAYESPRRAEVAELVRSAQGYEEQGKLEKSLKIFEQALAIKSSDREAKDGFNRVTTQLERIAEEALREQEREAAEIARQVERLLVAARMDQSMEKWVEALAGFQKTLSLDPQNAEAREAVTRLEKLLEHARGGVVVKTEPGGATVRLGGQGEDISPATYVGLKLGGYPVEIEKKGYDPTKKEVLVRKDQTTVLGPVRLNRSKGAVVIKSEPEGMSYSLTRVRSDVSSDRPFEQRSGRTPAVEADLATGVYQVSIQRQGWPIYRRNIQVNRDDKETVSTRFAQGTVAINSDPTGIEVRSTSGMLLGKTPLRKSLPTGSHRFTLKRPGHELVLVSLMVEADKEAVAMVKEWKEAKSSYSHARFQSPSTKSRVYMGSYGGITCITALQWLSNGSNERISGAVFVPSINKEYRIIGDNYAQGKLSVELWEGGNKVTSGRLDKTRPGANVVWTGTLLNGQTLQFSRSLSRSSSSFNSNYHGTSGGSGISVSLKWNTDRSVTGSMRNRSTGVTHNLYGDNSVEGFLYLDEMTGNRLSARILLNKTRVNGAIVWSGTRYQVDSIATSHFRMQKH